MSPEINTDIKSNSRLIRFLPAWARPYAVLARVDRPVGIWLLLLPCLWSLVLAGGSIAQGALFAAGAVVMRSAGCVVNDLWDRSLDRQVERTRMRPLAAGDLSVRQALVFLAILLSAGLAVLLQFNGLTIMLGILTLPMIALYPLMKRVTWWPQAFLGLVFNFGTLMGWSAASGELSWQAFVLYAAGILWTLAYDTIYAHQDIEDDAVIGVRSTARLFGVYSLFFVVLFYAMAWILLAVAAAPFGFLYMMPAAAYAAWVLREWQPDDAPSCLRAFQQSAGFGWLVLGGYLLSAAI